LLNQHSAELERQASRHELFFQVRKFSERRGFTLVFYSLEIIIVSPDQASFRKSNEEKILGLFVKIDKE